MERLAAEPDLLALDLAAGPGSASARLLRRLPGSRSVAVDADPVLLRLGEGAQGDHGGRLRWVQADLRDPAWVDARGQDTFDAVISTTALHWLTPPEVAQVYRQLAGLLRPGGVLLNGDLLPLPAHLSRIRAAVEAVDERRQAAALAGGSQAWQDWWDTLRSEPALRDAFAERDRLWPGGTGTGQSAWLRERLKRCRSHSAGIPSTSPLGCAAGHCPNRVSRSAITAGPCLPVWTQLTSVWAHKNYAGTSPITRVSGKKKVVLARYARNDRLAHDLRDYETARPTLTAALPG